MITEERCDYLCFITSRDYYGLFNKNGPFISGTPTCGKLYKELGLVTITHYFFHQERCKTVLSAWSGNRTHYIVKLGQAYRLKVAYVRSNVTINFKVPVINIKKILKNPYEILILNIIYEISTGNNEKLNYIILQWVTSTRGIFCSIYNVNSKFQIFI